MNLEYEQRNGDRRLLQDSRQRIFQVWVQGQERVHRKVVQQERPVRILPGRKDEPEVQVQQLRDA